MRDDQTQTPPQPDAVRSGEHALGAPHTLDSPQSMLAWVEGAFGFLKTHVNGDELTRVVLSAAAGGPWAVLVAVAANAASIFTTQAAATQGLSLLRALASALHAPAPAPAPR